MPQVTVVGLGPIGLGVAQALGRRPDLTLVGLVDHDAAKVGRSLPDLGVEDTSMAQPRVVRTLEEAPAADVAVVCTSSALADLAPTLRACAARRLCVVSSCEEMAFPRYRHADLADELDALARAAGVAFLGTGVNPGYVMDLLAVQLSSMLVRVEKVTCRRVVDVRQRRLPLQRKVGAGLTVADFAGRAGKIGHRGLAESVALVAAGLGKPVAPGSVREAVEPVVADRAHDWADGRVEPGQVRGARGVARWANGTLAVELDLTMALDEPDPHDALTLVGETTLEVRVPGSTPGDSATVAALTNAARAVVAAKPGLRTLLDMPACGSR